MESTETEAPQGTPDDTSEEPFEYPAPQGVEDTSEEPIEGYTEPHDPEPEQAIADGADLPSDEPEPSGEGDDLATGVGVDDDEPEPEPLGDPSGGHVEDQSPAQSVSDLAANGDGTPKAEEPPPVEGTTGQLSLEVGGDSPSLSTVKLMGVSREVEGEFKRGETVTFLTQARCGEIDFIDTMDAQGFVTKSERRHKFRVESVRRASLAALVRKALETEDGREMARQILDEA